MRKYIFLLTVFCLFLQAGSALANAVNQEPGQETTDEFVTRDTLSLDELDPVFYPTGQTDTGTENQGIPPFVIYIIIGVVVAGAGIFFFLRSKKK